MKKSKTYLLSLATFVRQYQVPPLMEGHSDRAIFLTMLTPGLCGKGNPAQSHILPNYFLVFSNILTLQYSGPWLKAKLWWKTWPAPEAVVEVIAPE